MLYCSFAGREELERSKLIYCINSMCMYLTTSVSNSSYPLIICDIFPSHCLYSHIMWPVWPVHTLSYTMIIMYIYEAMLKSIIIVCIDKVRSNKYVCNLSVVPESSRDYTGNTVYLVIFVFLLFVICLKCSLSSNSWL